MSSHKRSAWRRQKGEFLSSLGGDGVGGFDDAFEAEERRRSRADEEREAALRAKACESKNRYATHGDAEAAVIACEEHGVRGLRIYRCPYCNGWHLTSKPQGPLERG